MVFNKQICMLIYVNQTNGEKCFNFYIKNININIKRLRKTNRLLIENPSTRKPSKTTTTATTKPPCTPPGIYC